MLVKITRISKKDTKANGEKLISKYDKPYWNVGIQFEGNDNWYSTNVYKTSDPVYSMVEGGTYSIAISDTPRDGGGEWHNFKLLTDEEKELEELRAFKASQVNTAKPFEPASETEAEVDLDRF